MEQSDELGIDASKIGVSGDSAGGTLAAAVSYMDYEAETNYVGFQALLYPALTLVDEDNDKYQWDISKFGHQKRHFRRCARYHWNEQLWRITADGLC